MFKSKHLSMMAGVFLLLTITRVSATEIEATPSQEQVASNQALFEQAISLVNQARYLEGAELLSNLYQKTHASRVKLEWARALYLGEKKQEAKVLFSEVMALNPPYMVKEKINVFLEDISKYEGKINVSFGLIRDSNPKNITTASVINIFGQQYYYNPAVKAKSEMGVSYQINATKAINEQSPWYFGLAINGSKFNDIEFDKTSFEESISHKLFDSPRVYGKLAVEEYIFAGKLLYIYPSMSIKHSFENSSGYYMWDETKVGRLNYTDYDYLSGPMASVTVGFGKAITPQLNLGLELGVDRMVANENPYSFNSGTVGIVSNFFLNNLELKAQVKAVKSFRNYDAMDPIFGEIRSDRRGGVFATVIKTNWTIQGVTPRLELGYERNESNISLYSYNRLITNLYFNRTF